MRRVHSHLRTTLSAIDRAVEQWIGYTLPPPVRALAEAQFAAEPPGEACPRCGGPVGAGEVVDGRCGDCRGRRGGPDATVRLGPFDDPLRGWVHLVKYSAWAEMGNELGRRLGAQVRDRNVVDPSKTVVVPMAMPTLRRLHRGIDHALVIAEGVAEALDAPLCRALLRRAGTPQVGLGATARRRSGGRGVRVGRRAGRRLPGRDIVLVDDVITTGATVRRSTRVLRRQGPRRVIAAVLAVADPPGRCTIPQIDTAGRLTALRERLVSPRL